LDLDRIFREVWRKRRGREEERREGEVEGRGVRAEVRSVLMRN
jgi:hypothetical protein